jgi:hypothetical protein
MEPIYHLSQQMQHFKKHALNTAFLNLCQLFHCLMQMGHLTKNLTKNQMILWKLHGTEEVC